jgi:hypothetical protein
LGLSGPDLPGSVLDAGLYRIFCEKHEPCFANAAHDHKKWESDQRKFNCSSATFRLDHLAHEFWTEPV